MHTHIMTFQITEYQEANLRTYISCLLHSRLNISRENNDANQTGIIPFICDVKRRHYSSVLFSDMTTILARVTTFYTTFSTAIFVTVYALI